MNHSATRTSPWSHTLGGLGLVLLVTGSSLGLLVAPPERHMGDVSRMLYVHVPTAWITLVIYSLALVAAIASLWSGKRRWDAVLAGALEAGVVLNVLLLATGMLFARPTWGVWWTWDVRLTTSLVGLFLFAAVIGLRSFIADESRRASWSAVSTIVAWVDVPLIYFCVKWWRSIHQVQSSPETVSSAMVLPLRINAFAILFLGLWFVLMRARIEESRLQAERVAPPERLNQAALEAGKA